MLSPTQWQLFVEQNIMGRLLPLVVIAILVYWLLKTYRKQLPKDAEPLVQTEDMVRCTHCSVHLPKQESIQAGEDYYCSEAHRLAHMNKPE
jgi:uncharacterized protein